MATPSAPASAAAATSSAVPSSTASSSPSGAAPMATDSVAADIKKLGVDVNAAPLKDANEKTASPKIDVGSGAGTATAQTAAAAPASAPAAASSASSAPSAGALSSINVSGERKLPLVHGHHSAQGIRPTMEDEVVMYDQITLDAAKLNGITSPIGFYGVFDGHGGKKAAEFTREHLPRNLIAALEGGAAPADALTAAFVKTDADFTAICGADTSGTTAVTLLIEQSTRKFWVANAGDSRCIMSRDRAPKALSNDHKADRPDELERIRKAGGFVIHKRVMGELAISRAIGDKDFKAADFKLVIPDPEIVHDTIGENDDFFVIACDGLYDVMTNGQIVDRLADEIKVAARPSRKAVETAAAANAAAPPASPKTPPSPTPATTEILNGICTRIVTHAIDELHTRDNVSVILVKFK